MPAAFASLVERRRGRNAFLLFVQPSHTDHGFDRLVLAAGRDRGAIPRSSRKLARQVFSAAGQCPALHRETKNPARALLRSRSGPCGCGSIASGALTAIEAAIGAAR